jgi:hypothetical protein
MEGEEKEKESDTNISTYTSILTLSAKARFTLQRSTSEASYSASSITEGSGKESGSERKGSEKSNKVTNTHRLLLLLLDYLNIVVSFNLEREHQVYLNLEI